MPTGCAARTLSACTVGSCNYRDYKTATDTTCTPTNCTKGQTCTSASPGYYLESGSALACSGNKWYCPGGTETWKTVSTGYYSTGGTSTTRTGQAKCETNNYCVDGVKTACPTAYPYSDAGTSSDGYCYASKTNTGSQNACSQPANSASYTCGTCTPGTCNWRDYKSATDTTCTPNDCDKPVASVTCNTGYYTSGVTCPACTNKPDNSAYTGTATSNACPWSCNTGYGQTSANLCAQICTAGIQQLKSSTGVSIPLYTSAQTTHSIVVKTQAGNMCYASLASGAASGAINVNLNGTTYHAIY